MTASDDTGREARRKARSSWSMRVFREGQEEAAEDASALFWDSIPVNERALAVWKLSEELYALTDPEALRERRLPRAAYRVQRR